MKRKTAHGLKRVLSGALACIMASTLFSAMPVIAEEAPKYPYAIFAADEQAGITINSNSFTLNGSAFTEGYFSTTAQYPNINGIVNYGKYDEDTAEDEATEEVFDVSSNMILIHNKLTNMYFTQNCLTFDEDYSLSEMNMNTNSAIYVTGKLSLEGNIGLNNAIGAVSDVTLSGGNLNGNNTVIYSKFGDIDITSSQANVNGLIYAPFGTVTVDSNSFSMNGIIIAQNIEITAENVNINYSDSVAQMIGVESEELSWTIDDWEYLADTDGDGLPNLIEREYTGTDPYNPDTDGDGLPDGYELFTLGTDPTKADTDENGITDGDEDFDEDGLSNLQEYELGTDPWNADTDRDGLTDGDEVNIYGTDPLKADTDDDGLDDADELYFETDPTNPDTDGNGILDGDEKREQTFVHKVKNEDCAVEEVIVSMEGTGNLQKTTSVDSVMNRDIICTDVVGLVGEPFEITTESKFDKATITFKVDKSKLGDTEFDNLLFLWYDEENYEFVELETTHDEVNSIVSIETTHFSKYMIVDSEQWFEAWAFDLYSEKGLHDPTRFDIALVIDCSGSMSYNDPSAKGRKAAAEKFIESIHWSDRIAILAEDNPPKWLCGFTKVGDKTELLDTLNKIYSSGGNNFNASITKAVELFESESQTSHRYIIFLSDGECSVSDDVLKSAKDAGIKIYTVGFGTSSGDGVLNHMATYTDGQFYKAYTANELVDIYEEIGHNNYLDFDDTDHDDLPDIFEQSGMRVQNGQVIHTDYEKKDTDGDGLEDGQEINPRYKEKVIPYAYNGATEIVSITFVMYSNPETGDDSDMDGYADIEDPDPLNKPDIIGDKYDFLDGETYYIAKMVGVYPELYLDVQGNSTSAGAPLIMYKYKGQNNQKFKFEWCDTGYKIHALNNERLVLTLYLNDEGEYSVYMGYDLDLQGQLWEVLPYNNGADGLLGDNGLVIRSKVLYYEDEDTVGQSLYLSYADDKISVSTDRIHNTRLMTCAVADWTRFGEAYMRYVGWTYTSTDDIDRAMINYSINNYVGLSKDNLLDYNGVSVLVDQYGGNFPNLYLADVKMDKVCCEVMALYNALVLYNGADENYNFFKLAVECELSALDTTWYLKGLLGIAQYNELISKIIDKFTDYGDDLKEVEVFDGGFGCDREKLAYCLDAYNINYISYSTDEFNTLKVSKDEAASIAAKKIDNGILNSIVLNGIEYETISGIVAYEYETFAAHTFAIVPQSGRIQGFNRYSDHSKKGNYSSSNSNLTDRQKEIYDSIDQEILLERQEDEDGAIFQIGYLLIKEKNE